MRKEKQEELYYLYWIHRKSHKNLKEDGYVGVSFNPNQRFNQHRSRARKKYKSHLYNAINKYDDILYDIICIGSFEYICDLENKLRPKENIGWNNLPGGEVAKGYTLSEEAKQNQAESVVSYSKLDALNVLIDFYEKGMSQGEISKLTGISRWSVWNIVSGNHVAYPDIKDVRDVIKDSRPFKSSHCGELTEDLYNSILIDRESGISYADLADKYNIPGMTIRDYCMGKLNYLKKFKCYRVVDYINKSKQYEYNDRSQTLGEWAEEYNIDLRTLWARINSGWSLDKSLNIPLRTPEVIEYMGDTKTVLEWSKELDIKIETIYGRMRKGFSAKDCLSTKLHQRSDAPLYTYKGQTMNLTDWAKKVGIRPTTLSERLKRGWSIEKTLETPVRKTKCQ